MATVIWLLRQRDPLGPAGQFYKITDELGADYVAKGWAQRLQGDGPLRRPDDDEPDGRRGGSDMLPGNLSDLMPAEAAPAKRGPGRPRKAS